MKLRPRRVENAVAKRLSLFSSQYGYGPIERKPVIGRTGPDLTMNELGLVVDVKSRQSVPRAAMAPECGLVVLGGLMGIRLCELSSDDGTLGVVGRKPSVMVDKWWDHMNEWRLANAPKGITALALHRPGMPYDHITLFMKEWSVFYDRLGNL